jgi:DNA-binding LacI/PurR family transcriptional regulator
LQLGHRAIGYLGIQSRPYSNQQRLSGYQTALKAAGVEGREDWIMIAPTEEASSEEDVNAGRELLTCLLAAGVTAVFCYNDMMAIGGLMACREEGIVLPETLSIVGFDDVNAASFVTPQLTTIRQPKVQLGQLAMHVLLDLLDGRTGQNHILAPQLIVRNSTTPCTHG